MSNNETTKLYEKVGVPATLELVAEECTELAHACLKLSRYIRNENPAPGHSYPDLITSLEEEVADVYVTLRELRKTDRYVDDKRVSEIIDQKRKRMYERLGVKAESFIF